MDIIKVDHGTEFEINLDAFNRQQKINRIYVRKNDEYVLKEQDCIMDWSLAKKREVACDLADNKYISYLVIEDHTIIGFMSLVKKLYNTRMIMDVIQVDTNFRGQGIGRLLWDIACKEAKINGAEETISFYRSMGAVITNNPILSIVEEDPEDVQLVYTLK